MSTCYLPLGIRAYNAGIGCFGLAGCDGHAKRREEFRRESTDGNEKAAPPMCGQRRKFARSCDGGYRDTARYRCGERGSEAPDPDQESPACSCDREQQNRATFSRRLGGAYTARWHAAESATLEDQTSSTRTHSRLVPAREHCRTEARRRGYAPIRQGFASSATLALSSTILAYFTEELS
jgi:hypothetical protein